MKCLLLSIFISFLPGISWCQVYKFKAYITKITDFNGTKWVDKESNSVDILTVVNIDKDKIQTYGKVEGDYDIIKSTGRDNEEDGGTYLYFTAVDSKGEKCKIILYLYGLQKKQDNLETGGVASLAVQYGQTMLVFYLKKDE